MLKKLKHLTKEFLVFLVVFSLVCWSVSLPLTHFIKNIMAAGGVEIMYTFETGMPDNVFLADSAVPESIMKITAYETQAGANTIDSITIQIDQAMMNCTPTCAASPFDITDLGAISLASTSGISLWLDNGNGTFSMSEDTFISSTTATQASAWTTVADPTPPPDNPTNLIWQTTFSNLNTSIPTAYGSLAIFVVVRAENNINADPMHMFMPIIPQNGVNIQTAGICLSWPWALKAAAA